jgi:hypothetical protein
MLFFNFFYDWCSIVRLLTADPDQVWTSLRSFGLWAGGMPGSGQQFAALQKSAMIIALGNAREKENNKIISLPMRLICNKIRHQREWAFLYCPLFPGLKPRATDIVFLRNANSADC